MSGLMDPTFANGLRELLVARVEAAPRRRRTMRWRWGAGALLAIGLLGGGTAVATQFVQPGADEHTELAAPISVTRTGTSTVELGPRPKGASEVYLSLRVFDAGDYGLGRGGAHASFEAGDLGTAGSTTTAYLMPSQLDPGGTSFTITTSSRQLRWSATFTWVSSHTTAWGVNAAGQSYGVENGNGAPDLIAVTATNGEDGYVFSKDLDEADGTAAARSFHSPQDALDWQKEHEGQISYVPVYKSDGRTKIGVFQVGP